MELKTAKVTHKCADCGGDIRKGSPCVKVTYSSENLAPTSHCVTCFSDGSKRGSFHGIKGR